MVAIKLYNIETGHIEILTLVPTVERARAPARDARNRRVGAHDVAYVTEMDRRPFRC